MENEKKTRNFISGLMAGCISVILCNPLDVTRTKLNIMNSPTINDGSKYHGFGHTMRTIYKESGWKGFYLGFKTNIIAIPLFHSLFFPIYEYSKSFFESRNYNKYLQYFLSTAAAGSICNILTNPIWVIRTRVMVQDLHPEQRQYQSSNPWNIMKQMVKEEGISSLFKGLSASLFSVSNAMIYFTCYETMKEILDVNSKNGEVSTLNIFVASTVSKIVASFSTYPLIVIRTVLHDHKNEHKGVQIDQKLSFMDVVRYIKKENGVAGFYAGLKPDLVRLIPTTNIQKYFGINISTKKKRLEEKQRKTFSNNIQNSISNNLQSI